MTLNRYRVTYFDRLDWNWKELYILAESLASIKELADSRCAEQFRLRPYNRLEEVDSLEITLLEAIELPFVEREEEG